MDVSSPPKVFSRLCSIEISVSRPTVIKLIDTLGKNHDALVKGWKDDITTILSERTVS